MAGIDGAGGRDSSGRVGVSGFQRKVGYYTGVVYEWNLPTGHTCPAARECLVYVNRDTGKADNRSTAYRCYAASAERFPGVRSSRWGNFELAKAGTILALPRPTVAVRIHSSGDFFSQAYFDAWLAYCRSYPAVRFWAYTKSLTYWVARLGAIPTNLVLTASLGGRHDALAEVHGLRTATVVAPEDLPAGALVDTNDDLAREHGPSFFLLDNAKAKKPSKYPSSNTESRPLERGST